MIDPSIRLRRAIYLNDLVLVQRIIRNNPQILRNQDATDHNNSSLHLAAILGYVDITQFLIDVGHEDENISKNVDGSTPLMVAIDASQEATAELLATCFPRCIGWRNKDGMDALMLAARVGVPKLVSVFLEMQPNPQLLLEASDRSGNTALHYASAYGQLKCLRILLQAGADPYLENTFGCTPVMSSRTKDSHEYFVALVMEMEKRKAEEAAREKEMWRRREGGVRVVGEESSESELQPSTDDGE